MRRIFTLCSVAVLLALPASAQLAINNTTTSVGTFTNAAPNRTFAHTTTTLANRLLIVALHYNISAGNGTSAVTYNGDAMTLVADIDDTTRTRTQLFALLNPDTGTNNVVVSFTGLTAGETMEGVVSASTIVDVDPGAGGVLTAIGNTATPTLAIASAAGGLVIDFVSVQHNGVTITGNTGTDVYPNAGVAATAPFTNADVLAAAQRYAGAATVTTSTTLSATRRWTEAAVDLRPASADVRITQADPSPDPVLINGMTTFVYTITNTSGTFSSNNVNFSNTLPTGFTFVSATPSAGSCTGGTTTTCSFGTLAVGASRTVTITATAPATAGNRTNTATITTGTNDPDTADNTTSATVFVQNPACPTNVGQQGAVTNITGIVNDYWPGTANAAAGATTITLGTGATGDAGQSILIGNLLLVIQMQDAAIDSSNTDAYGDGTGTGAADGNGSGSTNLNNVGHYEYVVATATPGAIPGNVAIAGAGSGGGLIYNYTNSAATGTQGQRRFQVVRVPQYTTASLGAALTALEWNGTTGGVLAIDVAGTLTLNSQTVSVNGRGFRGAAGEQRAGGGAALNTDYVNTQANNAHGLKGEGIAGMPRIMYDVASNTNVPTVGAVQGYPNGDYARGAPGNAGGGGTDGDGANNDENAGGGGGGNGGAGGVGGNSWLSNLATGGFGGAAFTPLTGRIIAGGGGGAGSRNNTPGVVAAASGADGGGIVLIRAGNISGTATITANGSNASNVTLNDGGGGGGAGGSIVFLVRSGTLAGLTLRANGGTGGDAWPTEPPNGTPGERHGPGGGGAGGAIITNATGMTTSVTGGAHGRTTTALDAFGSTDGSVGVVLTTGSLDLVPGTRSGTICSPDLEVFITDSPDPVCAGNSITYTISATNNGPHANAAAGAQITIATPTGTTFVSMAPPAGWSCTNPTVGSTGTSTCTKATAFNNGTTTPNFTYVVAVAASTATGTTITATANVIAPATTPDPVPANNTDTTTTTANRCVDDEITKTASPTPYANEGDTLTYTLLVENNGPSRASGVTVSDPLPAGFTFGSVSPAGPTCSQAGGTVTCNLGNLDPGAQTTITITGTITVNSTILTNTATVAQNETDTNTLNNSSTASIAVTTPTLAKFKKIDISQDPKGRVLISWSTSYETDNLGFNIYRQGANGKREKINKQLIAGSSLFTKSTALRSGRPYKWKDKLANANEFTQYYLEDVDTHGNRNLQGPITPIVTASVPEEPNTDTIADLGSNGGIFLSPRGIGAPSYPVVTSTRAQLAQQWELAKQSAVKFMVVTEGWYRVKKSDIVAAGFDPGINSRALALYAEGIEQPITVDDGGDGKFDANDAIEFYGIGIDTPATGARAYWLGVDKGRGLRIKVDKSKARSAATASTPHTFQRVERTLYFSALVNNGDRENFFGAILSSATVTQDISVENLGTGANASLELVMQGATDGAHPIALTMNNASLGTVTFNGQQRFVTTVTVPLSLLVNGTNTLGLTALGGDFDISVMESLRLTYPHRLRADDDALKVAMAPGAPATIDGFTSNKIRAFDVTDPIQPIEVGVTVTGTGPYTASIISPDSVGTRSVLVLGATRIAAAAQIVPSRPSSWNDKKNAADLVIISARSLSSAATPLKTRRDAEGIATAIVDVQDLYDEFGFGERGPNALREFLIKTREWKKVPRYAILLGDATSDPRNYLGIGTNDLVPTKLIATRLIKTASDDWFGDYTNSGIPSIAIGRMPARTLAEAQAMINKVVNRNPSGTWTKSVAFVTSPNEPDFNFQQAATSLNALLPAGYTPTNVFTGQVADPHAAVVNAMNAGQLLVAYIGHGTTDLWLAGNFANTDAAALTNAERLPVVAGMTCLNGYFIDLVQTSLAESLLAAPNGGAVAVWTSSGLTEPDQQHFMTTELFKQLFGATLTLGDAVLKAKAATQDPDVRRTWVLLGDPSMKVK